MQRYDLYIPSSEYDPNGPSMDPFPGGQYVLHADHLAAVEAVERSKAIECQCMMEERDNALIERDHLQAKLDGCLGQNFVLDQERELLKAENGRLREALVRAGDLLAWMDKHPREAANKLYPMSFQTRALVEHIEKQAALAPSQAGGEKPIATIAREWGEKPDAVTALRMGEVGTGAGGVTHQSVGSHAPAGEVMEEALYLLNEWYKLNCDGRIVLADAEYGLAARTAAAIDTLAAALRQRRATGESDGEKLLHGFMHAPAHGARGAEGEVERVAKAIHDSYLPHPQQPTWSERKEDGEKEIARARARAAIDALRGRGEG